MKFSATQPGRPVKRGPGAFTLAEVLAAMLFLAIVIPVAMQGLRIASLAGEVGHRKMTAVRIGNKILNELKVTGQLQTTTQSGVVHEGGLDYKWSVKNQLWSEDPNTPMLQATLTVAYAAQGKSYDVYLTTLMPEPTQ